MTLAAIKAQDCKEAHFLSKDRPITDKIRLRLQLWEAGTLENWKYFDPDFNENCSAWVK